MTEVSVPTSAKEADNASPFAKPEAKSVVAPKDVNSDMNPFEPTPAKKDQDEAEAVDASEDKQAESSEAAPAKENTPKILKRMDLETMREFAEPIAKASKKHKDGIYTINLSTVSDAAKCDKIIATKIIHMAMDIAESYIKIVDDKPSTTITHPHVNSQHSLLIPSKTMQSIKGDDDKMLFPVGTKFTMTYDAEKIVLTKLA